jgi:hypothetical protein
MPLCELICDVVQWPVRAHLGVEESTRLEGVGLISTPSKKVLVGVVVAEWCVERGYQRRPFSPASTPVLRHAHRKKATRATRQING